LEEDDDDDDVMMMMGMKETLEVLHLLLLLQLLNFTIVSTGPPSF
jgi:hypothetical protein